MQKPTFWRRIVIGMRHRPLRLLAESFVVYAIIWTVLDPLINFIQPAAAFFSGVPKYAFLILVSIAIGIIRTARPVEIALKLNNSIVRIAFGDLFSYDGYQVVPISRFAFETDVVQNSLQNAVIQKYIESEGVGRGINMYIDELGTALQGKQHEMIAESGTQQLMPYYPLGTTAFLELNGNRYILLSTTKTEREGYIPADNCSVTDLWMALQELWREARTHSRGRPINLPLIGSGTIGIRLPSTRILDLLVLSIADALLEQGAITSSEIRIVLHSKYIDEVDLNNIQQIWH
jgi:hypothetical protein